MIRKITGMAALMLAGSAHAAPGVGERIYGATLAPNVTELEARYGRLTGGAADGEDGLVLEAAHSFGGRFYGAVLAEFERDADGPRKLAAVAIEGIVPLGRIEALQLDTALYGEYEFVRGAPDKFEVKALLEHRRGAFDARLNLVANRRFLDVAPVALEYATSADWAVAGDEVRLGAAAFGELGDTRHFLPRAAHFAGPIAKFEIEHPPGGGEIEIETGYLFAIGAARDETRGQLRLLVEWEKHF